MATMHASGLALRASSSFCGSTAVPQASCTMTACAPQRSTFSFIRPPNTPFWQTITVSPGCTGSANDMAADGPATTSRSSVAGGPITGDVFKCALQPVSDAIAAADALGRAGDPRFAKEVPLGVLLPDVLWVCAGRPELGLPEAFRAAGAAEPADWKKAPRFPILAGFSDAALKESTEYPDCNEASYIYSLLHRCIFLRLAGDTATSTTVCPWRRNASARSSNSSTAAGDVPPRRDNCSTRLSAPSKPSS